MKLGGCHKVNSDANPYSFWRFLSMKESVVFTFQRKPSTEKTRGDYLSSKEEKQFTVN